MLCSESDLVWKQEDIRVLSSFAVNSSYSRFRKKPRDHSTRPPLCDLPFSSASCLESCDQGWLEREITSLHICVPHGTSEIKWPKMVTSLRYGSDLSAPWVSTEPQIPLRRCPHCGSSSCHQCTVEGGNPEPSPVQLAREASACWSGSAAHPSSPAKPLLFKPATFIAKRGSPKTQHRANGLIKIPLQQQQKNNITLLSLFTICY